MKYLDFRYKVQIFRIPCLPLFVLNLYSVLHCYKHIALKVPLILPSVEAEDNGPEWADGFRGSHFPQLCSVGADIELQLQRSPKGELKKKKGIPGFS